MVRRVWKEPEFDSFSPRGQRNLDEIALSIDEYEALRLVDTGGMSQEEAAKKMGISQPTLNRLLKGARRKAATAITSGKILRIGGGNCRMMRRRNGPLRR